MSKLAHHIAAKFLKATQTQIPRIPIQMSPGTGWDREELYSRLYDALYTADVKINTGDVGIGPYEAWGHKGIDKKIEVVEVYGDDFQIELVFYKDGLSPLEFDQVKKEILKSIPTIEMEKSSGGCFCPEDDEMGARRHRCKCPPEAEASFRWVPTKIDGNFVTFSVEWP